MKKLTRRSARSRWRENPACDGTNAADPPNFLVLDEPANLLDLATKEMLVEALKDLDGTMLFVSHDRMFLRGLSNRVLELGGESGTEHTHPHLYPVRIQTMSPGPVMRLRAYIIETNALAVTGAVYSISLLVRQFSVVIAIFVIPVVPVVVVISIAFRRGYPGDERIVRRRSGVAGRAPLENSSRS